MTRSQWVLVFHALAIVAALSLAVPALTEAFGAGTGMMLSLGLYWFGFCLPVIAVDVWHRRGDLFSERLAWRDWWIVVMLLGQVGAVALIVFVPHTAMLTTQAAMLASVIALIHAPLGETAWRGGFLRVFAGRPRPGFWLGWLLCSAIHLPLLLTEGLIVPGGWPLALAIIAGLHLLWSAIVWRTGSVFWTTMAHTLTATVLFWLVLDQNALP